MGKKGGEKIMAPEIKINGVPISDKIPAELGAYPTSMGEVGIKMIRSSHVVTAVVVDCSKIPDFQ